MNSITAAAIHFQYFSIRFMSGTILCFFLKHLALQKYSSKKHLQIIQFNTGINPVSISNPKKIPIFGLENQKQERMNYWLMKTEPETFGWDDMIRDKKAVWDGVRNYTARN